MTPRRPVPHATQETTVACAMRTNQTRRTKGVFNDDVPHQP